MQSQLEKALRASRMCGLDSYTKNGVTYSLRGNAVVARAERQQGAGGYPSGIEILEGTTEIEDAGFIAKPMAWVSLPSTNNTYR